MRVQEYDYYDNSDSESENNIITKPPKTKKTQYGKTNPNPKISTHASHNDITSDITTHPATTHPATTHPATTHPATTHPATTHPATTHPATTHPATTHPATTHPATCSPKKTEMIPFWANNPNILFKPEYIFEFFPVDTMSYEQKLNAITRGIFIVSIFTFLYSKNSRTLIISLMTIFSIFILYYFKEREKEKAKKIIEDNAENFDNPAITVMKRNNISTMDVFDTPTSSNPFGNVLISDYEYNPNKKPAPPAFNENTNDSILIQAKKLVSELNPDQPDISDKLFRDLGEQYVFEQSLRQFTSNPSTTIPNDQTGFAEFAYGSMVSCKEGNLFACARNLPKYTN
jgi:hypothetical protein